MTEQFSTERNKHQVMSKAGFSIADLQQGAKKLNTVESPAADAKDAKAAAPTEVDRETTIALGMFPATVPMFTGFPYLTIVPANVTVRLYEKHDGDLDRM